MIGIIKFKKKNNNSRWHSILLVDSVSNKLIYVYVASLPNIFFKPEMLIIGCVHNCTSGENVDLTIGYQRYYC